MELGKFDLKHCNDRKLLHRHCPIMELRKLGSIITANLRSNVLRFDITMLVFELTRFIHIETFASTPNNETAKIISNLRSTSNVATIGMFYDSILRCHVLETFLDSTLIMEPPGSKFGSIINSVSFSNTGIAQHRTADKRTKG